MSEARFLVGYDGPGVEDGRMDVRQLAPALLSIGDLIERSNRVVNGEHASVNVKIQPATRRGSAIVDLSMHLALSDQFFAFFDPNTLADAKTLLALLGFLDPEAQTLDRALSLIEYIKVLATGRVTDKTTLDDGSVQLNVENNNGEINQYIVNGDVIALSEDRKVMSAVEGAVRKPLRDPTVDEFQVRDPDNEDRVSRRVTKEESQHFRPATEVDEEPEDIETGEFTSWVGVRKSWTDQPARKWQFIHRDGAPFNAKVTDDQFWEEMKRDRYPVSPHVKFQVRVRWRQEGEGDPEYEVVEVLDYQGADPGSTAMEFGEPGEEA